LSGEERRTPEDYLELIYVISEEDRKGIVRTKELSERLGVYPSTVTEMMQKLAERGLVVRISCGGVRLTKEGRRCAKATLRRHRILECFFFQYLGLDPSQVRNEVCGMEHHLSGEILDRLYEKLGRPRLCPHGKPIPLLEG